MAQLAFRSYAKINLTLEVLRRRADGYHDLASLVHTISLADELRVRLADDLACRVEGLDIDPMTNLVLRAARLLAATADVRIGAELSLVKRIPVAAGLGGGSSDAATALIGLNRLWHTHLSVPALTRLALTLGSDVPFFLKGGAALLAGRGDELELLPHAGRQWLVLVVPTHVLQNKTALLYASLEPRDFSTGEATRSAAARLNGRQALRPTDLMNAFTRAARQCFPGLADAWAMVERLCERRFFLSGAGPTLFALAVDGADARRQQANLARSGLAVRAAYTVGRARSWMAGSRTVDFASEPPIGYA